MGRVAELHYVSVFGDPVGLGVAEHEAPVEYGVVGCRQDQVSNVLRPGSGVQIE